MSRLQREGWYGIYYWCNIKKMGFKALGVEWSGHCLSDNDLYNMFFLCSKIIFIKDDPNVEGVHSCISGTNSSSSNVKIKVSISTQLSCLSPPPLPLSLVTVPTCSTVATPNRTYQWMGQWQKVLGGLLKLKECLLCGTERSESVRLGSCPSSHNPSPGAVPWGFLGCHRWTFIQLNIIHTHTRARTNTHTHR